MQSSTSKRPMNYHYDQSHKAPSVMAMDHPHSYSSLNHHPEIITSIPAPLPSDLFDHGEEGTKKGSTQTFSGHHQAMVKKTASSSPRSSPSRRRSSLYPSVKHVMTRKDHDHKIRDYVKDHHPNPSKGCYDSTKSMATWDKFEKTNKTTRQQRLHHSYGNSLSLSSSNMAEDKVVPPTLSKEIIHQTQLRRSRPLMNSDPRFHENSFSNLHNSDTRIVYDRREKIHQLYHQQEQKQDHHKQREQHKRNSSSMSTSSSSSLSSSSLSKSDVLGDLISRLKHSLSPQDGIDDDQDKRYKSVLDILTEVIELFNQPSHPLLHNNGSTNATTTNESSTASAATKGWSTRQLLPFILHAMNSYKTKKLVQLRSVIILSSFVKHNVGIKSFFARNRTIKTILGAMRDHPTYFPLQLCGCQLFDSLLEKAGNIIFTAFNEEGGLERVLQAASNYIACDGISGPTTRTNSLENVTKCILNKLSIIVRQGQQTTTAPTFTTTGYTKTASGPGTTTSTTVLTEAAAPETNTTTTIGTTIPTSTNTIDTLIADIVGLRLAALEVEVCTPMNE